MSSSDILRQHIALMDYEMFCTEHLESRPYPEQLSIAEAYDKYNFLLILMSRQAGKSWTISSKTLHYALNNKNKKILIFAPAKHQAIDIIFKTIKTWIEKNEFLMSFVSETNLGMKRLLSDYVEFKNGSSIRCLSASDKSNIVGFTGDVIILDECQNISDLVVYQRIEPMLGSISNPKYIKIGTPRGQNQFYESWKQGKEGNVWHIEEYPWQKCSRLNKTLIEQYKRTNPHFYTEYELKWMNNISSFFTRAELEDLFTKYDMKVYEDLFKEGRGSQIYKEIYCGIDWGKTQDKTVVSFVVNEAGKFRAVGLYEFKGDYREQIKSILMLFRIYNPLVVYMDASGSTSQSLGDLFQGTGYYVEPIIMTSKFKATVMYDNLHTIVNYRLLMLPSDNEQCEKEFYDLELTVVTGANMYNRIAHPEGGHDDYPDSIALACLGFREKLDITITDNAYDDSGFPKEFNISAVFDTINPYESRGGDKYSNKDLKHGYIDLLGD